MGQDAEVPFLVGRAFKLAAQIGRLVVQKLHLRTVRQPVLQVDMSWQATRCCLFCPESLSSIKDLPRIAGEV